MIFTNKMTLTLITMLGLSLWIPLQSMQNPHITTRPDTLLGQNSSANSSYTYNQDFDLDPRFEMILPQLDSEPVISCDEPTQSANYDNDFQGPYTCKQCHNDFNEKLGLMYHIKDCHMVNTPLYICWIKDNGSFCGKWHTRKNTLLRHSLDNHQFCSICKKQFSSQEKADQHRIKNHTRKTVTQPLITRTTSDELLQEDNSELLDPVDSDPFSGPASPFNQGPTTNINVSIHPSLELSDASTDTDEELSQNPAPSDNKNERRISRKTSYNLRRDRLPTYKIRISLEAKSVKKDPKHQCSYTKDGMICPKKFTENGNRVQHEINTHYFCSQCDKQFDSKKSAFSHRVEAHIKKIK